LDAIIGTLLAISDLKPPNKKKTILEGFSTLFVPQFI
jgi:hypothetical protein